jgi:hypothetical protein
MITHLRQAALLICFSFSFVGIQAQEQDPLTFLSPNYAFQIPAWDMAESYGSNSAIGADFIHLNKNNIALGFSGQFLFGSNVDDTLMLESLMDDRGNIIGEDGEIASITLYERGFHFQLRGGYFLPLKGNSSGLLALGGIGFLQHKTRIQVETAPVPQLTGEYLKMYDQLSNGLSTSGFLGWMHVSEENRMHFYAGLELSRAFTQNRRSYNVAFDGPNETLRNDFLTSFKLGWIIPLSKRSTQEYYYY